MVLFFVWVWVSDRSENQKHGLAPGMIDHHQDVTPVALRSNGDGDGVFRSGFCHPHPVGMGWPQVWACAGVAAAVARSTTLLPVGHRSRAGR